jgi:amidophosphoribosyltransferase
MCGIVGIYRNHSVAVQLYDSLIHLQHRGQDAAGIMTYNQRFHSLHGKGLVRDVFSPTDLNKLKGNVGIAHVRYPTAGHSSDEEIQPLRLNSPYGIAISHNGNLVNQQELAQKLQEKYSRHLNTSCDSEIILNLFANGIDIARKKTDSIFEQICSSIKYIHKVAQGSYSVVSAIMGKGLVAFRDPHGIRPLVYSKSKNSDGSFNYIFASEPTMFHSLGYSEIYNVQPGEVIYIDQDGNLHQKILTDEKFSPCIFEYVYFARPDAVLDEVSVYRARLRMGQNLALQWKKNYPDCLPDIVIPAPSTSNTAALSFAGELDVRYSEGLYKNPFIGRTFIMSDNEERKKSVLYKLSPQKTEILDKTVLILDDSIVRGTTSKEIIKMVRECGAKQIYLVTTCPPVKYPCFYGIDIPTRAELIATNKTVEEIREFLGVDKLLYQTIEDLVEAVTRKGEHHIDKPCLACLTGKYLHDVSEKTMVELERQRTKQRKSK